MEISVIIDEEFRDKVDEAWLHSIVEKVLTAQEVGPNAEMGLVITGQEHIHELNKQYLDEDRPTDVLSFPMEDPSVSGEAFPNPPDGLRHLGEVIISYPQAEIQAKEHNHSARKEVAILMIHGVLHLLGYDHDISSRKAAMQAREKAILEMISEGLD